MSQTSTGWASLESTIERASVAHRAPVTNRLLAEILRDSALAPAFAAQREALAQTSPSNAVPMLRRLVPQSRLALSHHLTDYQIPGPLPRQSVHTSGSTGQSIEILRTPLERQIEQDFVRYALERLNLPPEANGAALTGRTFKGGDHKIGSDGFLWISCPELGLETWRRVTQLLKMHRRDYLRGYGSLVGEYFAAVQRAEAAEPDLAGVAYSSDMMLPQHQRAIVEVTGARPIGLYGQAERALMAVTCEAADTYHVLETYGHAEILDGDGEPITQPEIAGTLAGTSLWPRGTAMVRYLTGDRASWVAEMCKCGRTQTRFRLVAGRSRDVLVDSRGGRHILGPSLYDPILRMLPIGCDLQFAQLGLGLLRVRVSRSDDRLRKRVHQIARESLGHRFVIEVVGESPVRTSTGKRLLLDPLPLR